MSGRAAVARPVYPHLIWQRASRTLGQRPCWAGGPDGGATRAHAWPPSNSHKECVIRRAVLAVPLANVLPLYYLTPDVAPSGAGTGPPREDTGAFAAEIE